MFSKDSVESAYCFIHQKWRVYKFSTMDWQKDDIEMAIADYVESMNEDLYATLTKGKPDFLRDHRRFAEELLDAVEQLEQLL